MIPKQLQKPEFRFILVTPKDKIPIEKNWQETANYSYDDKKLLRHIEKGGNYGVLCGVNNLVVIDFDNEEVQEEMIQKLPPTFTVRTGGTGLLHMYYSVDNPETIKILDNEKKSLADIQGSRRQVIGAGSVTKREYKVVNDINIAKISIAEIKAMFSKYQSIEREIKTKIHYDFDDDIRKKVSMYDIFKYYKHDLTKNPTECFFHQSKGKKSLSYNNELFYCFGCDVGGSIYDYVMKAESLDFNGAKLFIRKKILKEDKKKRKEEEIETSFINHDSLIIEQIYDPIKNFSGYAIWNGKEVDYKKDIILDGIKHIPLSGEEIVKNVVLLPNKAEEYGSIPKLVEEIYEFSKKYIDISDEFRKLSTWYVILTWVYDKVNTINYMRIQGDHGTGKSRYLDTFARISYKCSMLSGVASISALFRIVSKWKGSLYIEEADIKNSDEKNDFIKILNCGFEKGKPVIRSDKNDPNKLQFHDPYSPKWLGTRRSFDDGALESRCITEISKETTRKDIPDVLPNKFFEKQQELRNKLLMFRFKNYNEVNVENGLLVDLGDIEPRLRQATRSFASIFAHDQQMLDNFKVFLKRYNMELKQERAESADGQVINAVADLIKERSESIEQDFTISASDVTNYLIKENINLKATNRSVGRRLKNLGFNMNVVWRNNKATKTIDFKNEKLETIFKRYVVDEFTLPYVITFLTTLTKRGEEVPESIYNNNNNKMMVFDVNVRNVRIDSKRKVAKNFLAEEKQDVSNVSDVRTQQIFTTKSSWIQKITELIDEENTKNIEPSSSEIAEKLNISETKIYPILQKLHSQGILFCPKKPDHYRLLK